MFGWMLRSQMPVKLLGAWTSWSGPAGGGVTGGVAGVVVVAVGDGVLGTVVVAGGADGLDVGVPLDGAVDTAAASRAGQPKRDASAVARSPPA